MGPSRLILVGLATLTGSSRLTHQLIRGLLNGTDLNSVNSFCDVIFSLMRKICYTQYIDYKKTQVLELTRWWSGNAYIVVDDSVLKQIFYFSSCRMYELI
jgi:hypothetical protein